MAEMFVILGLTIVVPLWIILHYVTEWKKNRGLSSEDEKMLDEVYDVMERMDDRLKTLESILDGEDKDWRGDDPYDRRAAKGEDGDAKSYPREAS
jgi:phage shock protein B